MVWDTGSIKTSKRPFNRLRWRLLLSYLGVMMAILGSSTLAVYQFFATSLYTQLDRQLLTLADAGMHGLNAVKERYGKSDASAPLLDNDGDLDIPGQNFRQPDQGIEWFDQTGQLLAKQGRIIPPFPLMLRTSNEASGHTVAGGIRTLTWVAHQQNQDDRKIEGYVRVSQSTEAVEEVLVKLRWGMMLGGAIAASLTTVGGIWLTDRALKPIEASFNQLKQFTADASHELRSPLTAIKTSVDVMLSHPERVHPTDVKKMDAIASALKQMTRLVEDLLMLARSDRSTHPSEWVVLLLEELLEDLVELWLPQAEAKDITLRSQLLTSATVQGDAFLLQRLFANLLENALNYTPAGGTVTVSLKQQENAIAVSIQDTGMGIAPEHLPLIFDRLWRADKARTHRTGGSGLGLAIAKSIAQQHQAKILVTSQLGVGTSFQVLLPTHF
ncbi:HAMP domain-containing sensor histidine kinase [Roseofilum sp. Guam]|uniref:sensor histidine kinase n=1 Tax=Roseofilum sp. Guam TaxID=2821502 RepID=UPI001B00C02B|nr:HAMP domain-containing sensor histidine kinase [Roseofilum sp. Guam]MBP0030544.1 two-component sensor histidine kinase [Roseofilum sp. Guam]